MGNIQTVKVVMIGPSGSGKTHFLYMVKYGDSNGVMKTAGYNQERMVHNGANIHFVDIGAPVPTAKSGEFKQIPPILLDKLLEDAGCLYYFVDGKDDLETLLAAKSELLALMTSKRLSGIPVAIIRNLRPSVLVKNWQPKRSWEEFRKGLEVERLASFVKVFVMDLSYTEDKPVKALLDFTIKHGISH